MKAVLYGDYPAFELTRLRRFVDEGWELAAAADNISLAHKAALLTDADALITARYDARDPVAPRLRLLQCANTGIEKLDISRIPTGCAVCNVYGHENAVAEYVTWAILDWSVDCRAIPPFLSSGRWSVEEWVGIPSHSEAAGKTVGIVGFGRIGRALARRAKALDMRVTALSTWRDGIPQAGEIDHAYTEDTKCAFLADVNYLVVCCPLTERTAGMIDWEWFAATRHDAVIIHVGRGPVVEEESLYGALRSKAIRGATIDVWYEYPHRAGEHVPFARFPFHDLPNVVMTPHIAARSEEAWDRRFRQIAGNLGALSAGMPLAHVVVPPAEAIFAAG